MDHRLTSSRLSCKSLLSSISLNTFVVGGESPMLISSTSNKSVAPPKARTLIRDFHWLVETLNIPGMTVPAPRSPYPRCGGIVNFLFSPEIKKNFQNFTSQMNPLPWLTDAHVSQSLVPSLNDLSGAQLEGERLISVITVKKKENERQIKTSVDTSDDRNIMQNEKLRQFRSWK